MDVGTGHLSVADKKACRRKGSEAAADQISAFFIDALGLFRTCKGFIVAVGLIDSL